MTDFTLIKTAADHAIKSRGTLLADAAKVNYDGLVTAEAVLELACAYEHAASDLKYTQKALDDTSMALDSLKSELEQVKTDFDSAAEIIAQLKAENEALLQKITTVHFVCDRIPDQDGCRFIELENPQGESLGDEAGKWEIREDGLAQLVVGLVDDGLRRDAERYRWARGEDSGKALMILDVNSGKYEEAMTSVIGSRLDDLIDAAMSKESGE